MAMDEMGLGCRTMNHKFIVYGAVFPTSQYLVSYPVCNCICDDTAITWVINRPGVAGAVL